MQILLRLIPQCGRFVQLLNERTLDAGNRIMRGGQSLIPLADTLRRVGAVTA